MFATWSSRSALSRKSRGLSIYCKDNGILAESITFFSCPLFLWPSSSSFQLMWCRQCSCYGESQIGSEHGAFAIVYRDLQILCREKRLDHDGVCGGHATVQKKRGKKKTRCKCRSGTDLSTGPGSYRLVKSVGAGEMPTLTAPPGSIFRPLLSSRNEAGLRIHYQAGVARRCMFGERSLVSLISVAIGPR